MRLVTTALLSALLAIGCSSDDGDDGNGTPDAAATTDAAAGATFGLTIELNGFGMAHNGDTVYFAVWDDANTTAAIANVQHVVVGGMGGGNDVDLGPVIVEGKSYAVYFYADIDANATCEMGTDHHWRIAIPTVTAAVTEAFQHTVTFNGDCTKQ